MILLLRLWGCSTNSSSWRKRSFISSLPAIYSPVEDQQSSKIAIDSSRCWGKIAFSRRAITFLSSIWISNRLLSEDASLFSVPSRVWKGLWTPEAERWGRILIPRWSLSLFSYCYYKGWSPLEYYIKTLPAFLTSKSCYSLVG